MTDALEVLEPSGSSVKYGDDTLTIRPLKIGQLPKLVRTARPVLDAVLALDELPEENSNAMVALVLDLIEKHAEKVFEAASICTGKPVEWLQEGGIDEFVLLAMKVFEVNRDFFALRLGPLLGGLAIQGTKAIGGGPTPSSSSSSTTTASPTSADTPSGSSAPSATPQPAPETGSS